MYDRYFPSDVSCFMFHVTCLMSHVSLSVAVSPSVRPSSVRLNSMAKLELKSEKEEEERKKERKSPFVRVGASSTANPKTVALKVYCNS